VFTGLIQSLGKLTELETDRFFISVSEETTKIIFSDLAIGDSVAVDGVCLTVEEILANGFIASVSRETLQRSTLGDKALIGGSVNLETSLRVGSKIGGHFVTGHVDSIGCLLESIPTDRAWEMRFGAPTSNLEQWDNHIVPFLISKGSIAINGISLTIADCDLDGNWFTVAVIPHTYSKTNLTLLEIGERVNLETDVLGKYVSRLLHSRFAPTNLQEDISWEFLAEHGYL
jgi:riboflavin synthase